MHILSSGYIYLAGTVFFAVLSNIIFRSQIKNLSEMPETFLLKLQTTFLYVLTSPSLIFAYLIGFLGGLCWIVTLTKLELSSAYPMLSLTYVLILFIDVIFFNASLNVYKVFGTTLIFGGAYLIIK